LAEDGGEGSCELTEEVFHILRCGHGGGEELKRINGVCKRAPLRWY
jgi:hypothetical protein